MARQLTEIYDSAINEKESMSTLNDLQPNIDSSQTLLNDLTSTSKVAKWRLIIWICCFVAWIQELLFDEHKTEVEARAAELITGTPLWYRDQCLVFQYGDDLVWNGKKYVYDPIDENNQIVDLAAVIEQGGQVRLKVAKLDGGGLPTPLSAPELASFNAYIQQIKFAGTNIAVISKDGDDFKLAMNIYYDPLVMASDGSLISDPGTFPVEDAIIGYLQSLPFNGQMDLNQLVDAVQISEGVVSPFLLSADARALPAVYAPVNDFYLAEAGYLRIDPTLVLSDMLTYIANV